MSVTVVPEGEYLKRPRVGNIYYATDYRELVRVLAIESRDADFARCLIERVNGDKTSNYPSYLLRRAATKEQA